MRLAIVHDWIVGLGGAERVLLELHKLYPQAPIYTLFYNSDFARHYLPDADIRTSWLNNLPLIVRRRALFIPLMPSAIESFDLSAFDTVLSSSVIFSKGLILRPKTRHICYCYSPARQLWDWNSEYGRGHTVRHFLRLWDYAAASRVDRYIAISGTVAGRIKKYYGRNASVVYPPIDMPGHPASVINGNEQDYFLAVSRLYPHKNMAILVEAFNKLGHKLVVVGDGPQLRKLRRQAGPRIHFVGYQPDDRLADYYARCRAFIMPQEEDFGLAAVEAMSFGKPVLALRRGGAIETVTEGITGEFFEDPIPEALADGVKRLNQNYSNYDRTVIKKYADGFSSARFGAKLRDIVEN